MSDVSDLPCASCEAPLERVRYFPRQMLTALDMSDEQDYFREKIRRHNRYLHGWGVVCGCAVEPVDAGAWTVRVCPGFALGPDGNEIFIRECVDVDLKLGAAEQACSVRWPCPPVGEMPAPEDGRNTVYIAVRYAECFSRPVRVHPSGCGCDETGCEYSRVRDSWEIKVLWSLPESHQRAAQDDEQWAAVVGRTQANPQGRPRPFPVPPCPECATEPWVVLAAVTLPSAGRSSAPGADRKPLSVSYADRRVLLSVQHLQVAMQDSRGAHVSG